ncbi:hypothetical protein ColLi_13720 [Colletotrichum liriopes]|uniref:Uncharacterized protein n=1 Tax=Colletotrichum liriopes TaxID=708192 RepID=A0AA37LZT1_9PEZI|nr:hypothetical protein ColLi_13720 [Colletotrichum liriopes]
MSHVDIAKGLTTLRIKSPDEQLGVTRARPREVRELLHRCQFRLQVRGNVKDEGPRHFLVG